MVLFCLVYLGIIQTQHNKTQQNNILNILNIYINNILNILKTKLNSHSSVEKREKIRNLRQNRDKQTATLFGCTGGYRLRPF